MKCTAYIDPKTGIALKGEALENASKNPDAPRCGYELGDDDVFCPSCGRKSTHTDVGQLKSQRVNPRCFKTLFADWMSFNGRISRKEFGKKVVRLLAIVVVIFIIGAILEAQDRGIQHCCEFWRGEIVTFVNISLLIVIGLFMPILIRRIHDHGMSAWNLFLALLLSVFLLPLYLICLGCCRGDLIANKYGACPSGDIATEVSEKDLKSNFPELSYWLLSISVFIGLIIGISSS